MIITINNKTYNVQEAKTDKELEQGLTILDKLPEDEGMLFYMPDKLSQQIFTMKGMKFPIDIIFINQDQEVIDVSENCQPEQLQIVSTTEYIDEGDYIAYVLEINPNSGVKVGDYLEFEGEEEPPVMKVLDSNGEVQMELWGGERIISRRETKTLIKKAKRADQSNSDIDYKSLGRYIFKVIKGQDERPPEYIQNTN